MRRRNVVITVILVAGLATTFWLFDLPQVADTAISTSPQSIERGRYLVDAGGCVSCHEGVEDSNSLSGGLSLESYFGTCYVPIIPPSV